MSRLTVHELRSELSDPVPVQSRARAFRLVENVDNNDVVFAHLNLRPRQIEIER